MFDTKPLVTERIRFSKWRWYIKKSIVLDYRKAKFPMQETKSTLLSSQMFLQLKIFSLSPSLKKWTCIHRWPWRMNLNNEKKWKDGFSEDLDYQHPYATDKANGFLAQSTSMSPQTGTNSMFCETISQIQGGVKG